MLPELLEQSAVAQREQNYNSKVLYSSIPFSVR
jgi:hypothetical protein